MWPPFPLRVRKRRFRVFERLAETVCHGGIDQQAHRHHQPERHQALRRLQRPRGGEQLRVLQPAAPPCHRSLARGAGQHRWRRQLGGVEGVRGADDTPRLVDAGVVGS